MLLVVVVLVGLLLEALGLRQAVDEEAREELEVGAHPVAILPAIGHYLVDLIGTFVGLVEPLAFLDQLVDLSTEAEKLILDDNSRRALTSHASPRILSAHHMVIDLSSKSPTRLCQSSTRHWRAKTFRRSFPGRTT
jgi:hypothetical protein